MQEDRRQFTRVPFSTEVFISQGDHRYQSSLVDISLNGILVAAPKLYHLRSDLPCLVNIPLCSDVNIQMQSALVHSGNNALGFHCTSIDMDSITHLRRLIEANLGDPHAPERVLSELVNFNNMTQSSQTMPINGAD